MTQHNGGHPPAEGEPRGLDGQVIVETYAGLRRTGARLIVVALLVMSVIIIALALTSPATPQPDFTKLGTHLLLDDGRQSWSVEVWPQHFEYAAQVTAPGAIAVQVTRSDDLDLTRWQTFMDLCAQYDLTPVLRLATVYDRDAGRWAAPPADPDGRYTAIAAEYAQFIAALDWPGDARHVILLNEPNRGDEWGGQPDPAAYARFVVDVSAALRAAAPDVVILNAAFDLYAPYTGDQPLFDDFHSIDAATFMDAMRAEEPDVFSVFDVWNSHPYPLGGFIEPPWEQRYHVDILHDGAAPQTPPPDVFNRGINGYAWELWKLASYGVDDLPVMVTETGWRFDTGTTETAQYPPADVAASFMDMALRGNIGGIYRAAPRTGWTPLLVDERVIAVAPFALNGHPSEWGHTSWLVIDHDGHVTATRPVFDTISYYMRPLRLRQ